MIKRIALNELRFLINKIIKEEIINNKLNYRWIKDGLLEIDFYTKDAIIDEFDGFINEKNFTLNPKNGLLLLWVDWMDYKQFDKLAKFLNIKY